MHLVINGQDQDITCTTLAELVSALKLDAQRLVAEVNGTIVARENFGQTVLKDNDRLELVHFVGGG
ncbi:MAG: sulfur carrier protein ThiS [Desulfovibrio sp.]|nr:sulfur carrier protein ThiS [Desulfovibrio sp.]